MHLSPSQLYKLINCEASWGFKYIDKVSEPKTTSLLYGSCFDQVTNQIVSSLNKGIPVESADELWENAWYEHFTGHKTEDDLDVYYNRGVVLSDIFLREYAPGLVGSVVQPDLGFDLDGFIIKQRADFLLPDRVIDIKTASKSPTKNTDGFYTMGEYHKLQTISYAIGAIRRGYDILSVQTIVAVGTKEPKIVTAVVEVTPEELEYVTNLYKIARYKAENNNGYLVANRMSMMCSRKNCPYWNLCEEKYGGRVK